MQLLNEATRATGGMTGMQGMPIQPVETPEKEMERRRDIVNLQYGQAKNMIGNLPAGTEKPQIPEAFPLEGYIVVNGGEKEFFNNEVKTDLLYTIKERFDGNRVVLHAWDAARGREKEYRIESLSTMITAADTTCPQGPA